MVETLQGNAEIHLGDCITMMPECLRNDSVHLCVSSIPFESLFSYSGKLTDLGNNPSEPNILGGRFALNMRFVIAQLYRVLAPGCNACIHVQTLLSYKNQHGVIGRRDFRGAVIDLFCAAGFVFYGEFVIAKDPQRAANTLNLISLQFKTGYARNGCTLAPWINDYVVIFKKPGQHPCPPKPLKHKKNPRGWVSQDEWIRDACGVWSDILEIDVLQGAGSKQKTEKFKEDKDEAHVCPLQLEVIRRCVRLYTNPISIQPDVLVLDPFVGIGSAAYVCLGGPSPVTKNAVEEPRNFVGFELKESYHKTALKYAAKAQKAYSKANRDLLAYAAENAAEGDAEPEAAPADAVPTNRAGGYSVPEDNEE